MMLSKRTLCLTSLSMLASSYSSVLAQTLGATQTPNILLIVADDLGYGDVGCYGQELIRTPHIDSLARHGVRMTNFYAGTSVSAPSRASLMTGLHTGHTNIRGNLEIQPEGQAPLEDRATLASVLAERGYRTGIFGKWGLGFPGSMAEPVDRGFDTFVGYNCQRMAHYYYPTHLWRNERRGQEVIRERFLLDGNADDARQTYAPEVIQAEAVRFIREAHAEQRPFLAMMTYTLPHAELNLPHDSIYHYYRQRLTPRPWDGRDGYPSSEDAHASFAAMVERLDSYIGELCCLLNELGIADNTLIVFTSDNGPHSEGGADPQYFKSSGPLRGIKRALYEGGIRVPLVATWAGKIPQGLILETPGAFWDMLPTLAEIGDADAPKDIDGISLAGLWQSGMDNAVPNDRVLYWEFHEEGGRMALRQGKWKLIAQQVKSGKPIYELYDLEADLGETTNLVNKYPKRFKRLKSLLHAQRTEASLFKL